MQRSATKPSRLLPTCLPTCSKTIVIPTQTNTTESLGLLRQQIDRIDDELIELLAKRMRVLRDIGRFQKEHRMSVVQPGRYNDLMQRRVDTGVKLELDAEFVKAILGTIHEESVRQQVEICSK